MKPAGVDELLTEKLRLEYDEKLEEERKKLLREFEDRLEQEKRKHAQDYAEKEDTIKSKMELEIKKKEDVIREMYEMKLKKEITDVKKQVELELKDKYAREIAQKRFIISEGCSVKTWLKENVYPFTAIIGQEPMKKALLFNTINPGLGGVLLWGNYGVGKTTAVLGIGEFAPSPDDKIICVKGIEKPDCRKCDIRYDSGVIGTEKYFISYTIDRVLNCASIAIEGIGEKNIAPSKIVVSAKPEEEEMVSKLMLLNKMPLQVKVDGIKDMEQKLEIIRRQREFRIEPEKFRKTHAKSQNVLYERIIRAKRIINVVTIPEELLRAIVKVCDDINIENHTVHGLIEQVARTESAYQGRHRVIADDLVEATELVLLYSWGIPEKERMSKDQLEALVRLHTKK